MSKVVVLLLVTFGAIANAEDMFTEILVDRASNNIVGEVVLDMDDATLAKPAKASAVAKTVSKKPAPPARQSVRKPAPPQSRSGVKRGARGPVPGTFTAFKKVEEKPRRVFGGTNTLMAGKGMAIQETPATPSFWGGVASDKGIGYGWSVGGKKVNSDLGNAPARPVPQQASGTFRAFATKKQPEKRVFGGTNTLMAGKGKAIQEEAALPSYWGGKKSDKGIGYGWFQKAKALPEAQTVPFIAQSPPAQGFGGARPPIMMGNRPLAVPR